MSESAPSLLPLLPPEPGSLIGRQLGDYILERLIGVGGMGEVYLAQQISLPRAVALKILRFELSRDEQYLRRFRARPKPSRRSAILTLFRSIRSASTTAFISSRLSTFVELT